MAVLTTQSLVSAGTAPSYATPADANGGDTAEVGSGTNTFLHFKNTNAATRTITLKLDHNTLSSGAAYPDKTFTLGANTGELWIPLRKEYANDAVSGVGRMRVNTSASLNVSVAVIQVG